MTRLTLVRADTRVTIASRGPQGATGAQGEPGIVGNLLTVQQATSDVTAAVEWGGTATRALSTEWAASGTNSVEVTATAPAAQFIQAFPQVSEGIVAGAVYTLSAQAIRGVGSRDVYTSMIWYDATGAHVGTTTEPAATINAASATLVRQTHLAPTAAAKALPVWYVTAGAASDTVYLDELGVWQGIDGEWSPPGYPIVGLQASTYAAGSVSTEAVADGAVTGAKLADGAVSGSKAAPIPEGLALVGAMARHAEDWQVGAAQQSLPGRLIRADDWISITSEYADDTLAQYLRLTGGSSNNAFVVYDTRILPTHTPSTVLPYSSGLGRQAHSVVDDTCPVKLTWTYIGGNHGYLAQKWTVAGHDKTAADVGSVWAHPSGQLTLVKVAGDVLYFLRGVVDLGGGAWGSVTYGMGAGTITHTSGATHTANIVAGTSSAVEQLYPTSRAASVTTNIVDGYDGALQTVVIDERYEVPDYKTLIEYGQANPGSTYADWVAAADLSFEVANRYTFAGPLCIVDTTLTVGTTIKVEYAGAIQSAGLTNPEAGGSVTFHCPGLADKSGTTYDVGFDVTTAPPALTWSSAEQTTPDLPPTRLTMVARWADGDVAHAFRFGYCDMGDSSDLDRLDNSAAQLWFINSNRKVYPSALAAATVTPGTTYRWRSFRQYLAPDDAGSIPLQPPPAARLIDGGTP